ncbi:MAG: outer membrane lipoprotein-sorting protein [Spirochaetaceae bacterium]|jgi:outer membrane lipoprotein-sorting protein|nr:outer membrane lipoprotein-sorting protein [Spirochaetaceae bacterium]
MKKYLFVFFTIVVLFAVLPARVPGALWAISDEDLLKKVDSLASYYGVDFSAEYTIVQDKPGQSRSTTVAGVFRRDSDAMYTIIIIQPAINKGQGYLKQGGTLWFYDPESKRFNSTSSRDRFQNSNARNSDFTRSTLADDYKISGGEEAVLGRFKCRVLTLEASNNEVTYPRMKVWISEDGLVRKTEDYSLSGQLLRTSAIPDYYKMGERYVPKAILLVDALRGATVNGVFVNEKTQISISKPSFAPVSGAIFSKTYLEKVAR